MLRFAADMERYPVGTLLTAKAEFASTGAVDDLAYQTSAGRSFIAASTTAAGQRVVLHQGPFTFLDQAAEVVIDRAMPTRVGGEELGVCLLWQVSGCSSPSSVSCDGSGDLARLACQPADDASLGTDHHIKVLIDATRIRVRECRGACTDEVWSMPIADLHRKIALRVAHVDGDLLVWWNPLGERVFLEAPVYRGHTLLSGAGKMGLVANRDGRFLEAVFEYVTETVSLPIGLGEVVSPEINLTPVRVAFTPDQANPPMQVGMQVAHADDTRLPERQERTSRVFLRDGRFLLRPGHTYTASVWARSVDDETIVLRTKPFTLAGGCEDTRLRDGDGRLILRPDEDTPEGEARSEIDVLVWPENLVPSAVIRTNADMGVAELNAFQDNRLHGLQNSSKAPRVMEVPFPDLSIDEREELVAFVARCHGRTRPFLWTHPITGEHLLCRFLDPSVAGVSGEGDRFNVTVGLMEDTTTIEQDTLCDDDTSDSGGGSGGGGSHGGSSGGPPGPCPAGPDLQLWAVPCNTCDDQTLPALPGQPLRMPTTLRLRFRDLIQTGVVGGDMTAFITALGLGNTDGTDWLVTLGAVTCPTTTSRNHHHSPQSGGFVDPDTNATVTKSAWGATKTYTGGDGLPHTIQVRVQAELFDRDTMPLRDFTTFYGMLGTLLPIYVFTDEFAAYTDGDTVGGFAYHHDDPYVYSGGTKHRHPHLMLAAHVVTTWESSCLGKCDTNNTGQQIGPAYNNRFFGPGPTSDGWCMTLGGDCAQSRLYPLVAVEDEPAVLPLRVGRPGWNPHLCAAGSSSSVTLAMDCDPGAADAVPCCPSPDCWSFPSDQPPGTVARFCCWPVTARFNLTLTSVCALRCNDMPCRVLHTYIRRLVLLPDTCDYDQAGPTFFQDFFQWRYSEPLPGGGTADAVVRFDRFGWAVTELNALLIPGVQPGECGEASECISQPPGCACYIVGTDGQLTEGAENFYVNGQDLPPVYCPGKPPPICVARFACVTGEVQIPVAGDKCADDRDVLPGCTGFQQVCWLCSVHP